MTTSLTDHHYDETSSKIILGFWVFIMSDCIMFSTLFICYVVLHYNTFGGVGIKDIASLPYTLVQTLCLLTSSLTFGLSSFAVNNGKHRQANGFLFLTILLGLTFLLFEYHEFANIINSGHSWTDSAFLSVFFSLVGLHGLHVFFGIIWVIMIMIQLSKKGCHPLVVTRHTCLGLFWHFLDIIWIFIFSIVYLLGVI